MMSKATQDKNDQFLIDYLRKIHQLNDFEFDIPQQDINEVINNPKQYALDFIELMFAKSIPRFLEAFKAGQKFGKNNK